MCRVTDAAKKKRGPQGAVPEGRVIGDDPAERLLGGADAVAGAAGGDPVRSGGGEAAAIDLDRVPRGGLGGIAVTGDRLFVVLGVAARGGEEVVGVTGRPWGAAAA